MRQAILFLFLCPALLYSQWYGFTITKTALESKGLVAVLQGKIPGNADLKKVSSNNGRAVYCITVEGVVVEGYQLVAADMGAVVLISMYAEPDPDFAKDGVNDEPGSYIWHRNSNDNRFYKVRTSDSAGFRKYITNSGKLLEQEDMHRYFTSDTQTKARVFMPDPLSRAGVHYGGIYQDRGDSNYAELQVQQGEVEVNCDYSGDSFRLVNRYLSFAEVSPPVTSHAVSADQFYYTRDEDAFEEVNIYYHICELGKWWDSMGFGNYRDTVVLDAHAFYGADESAFDPTVVPPTIEFGDGGVDDGEDGDSPVHEYTHAAFHSLLPDSYNGYERKACEEGLCDFMAYCYSERCCSFEPWMIYNWDGHNEFWDGRNLKNDLIYPGNLTGQEHVDGQIIGGAYYDLATEIGRDSALSIMMRSMPFMVANMSMRNIAALGLLIDSVNGSPYRWPLIKAFNRRGLVPWLGISDPDPRVVIKNTREFMENKGPVVIEPNINCEAVVYDFQGRVRLKFQILQGQIYKLNPEGFAAGVYVLRVGEESVKLIKN